MNTIAAKFQSTNQKMTDWIKELQEIGSFEKDTHAYHALVAVLHALRDRLPLDEAVQVAAQFPMLLRGAYYEGWKPARSERNTARSQEEFLGTVAGNLHQFPQIDAEKAGRSVFSLLERKVTDGEIADVKASLPKAIRELWS